MNEKKMKICLMGASTSTNNRGVSALAVSLVKIILSINADTELSFIIGSATSAPQKIILKDKALLIPTIGYRMSPKTHPKHHLFSVFLIAYLLKLIPFQKIKKIIGALIPILHEMQEADIIADIQGGDSFSDIYGGKKFVINSMLLMVAILLKKRVILLPQTYGPYKSWFSKCIARYIISNADLVLSRDKHGFKTVHELFNGRKNINVVFSPDVAFMLDPIPPDTLQIEPPLSNNKKVLVGVNINGLMYNGGYNKNNMFGLKVDYKTLMEQIIGILLKRGARILLIPHTYGAADNVNSDPHASELIMSNFYNDDVHIVKGEYNQSEVKHIIGRCDFFIGSRMHACIAALSQGIPTVGVAYSGKFIGVFESAGMKKFVLDCRELNIEEIIENIISLYENRYRKKEEFEKDILEIKKIIENVFKRHLF